MSDNIGIGIMSSINLVDRYKSCQSTWLKDFDNTYIFGGDESDKFDKNLIPIKGAGENWESAFLKQQMGLKYMFEINPGYDWYCIVGCDNILFKSKVVEELSKYNKNEDLFISQPCGLWNDYPFIREISNIQEKGINFRAIAGGSGFFISNSLMSKCYKIIDEFNLLWTENSKQYYGCSDVALSYMIKKYFDIDLIHNPYMLSQNPDHYKNENNHHWYRDYSINILEILKTPLSLHYINPQDMEKIYKEYK